MGAAALIATDEFLINVLAGALIMLVEIGVIFLVINRGVAGAQRRAEARRWAATRAHVLANLVATQRTATLLVANMFRPVPLKYADEIARVLEAQKREPLSVLPIRIVWVVGDIEREFQAVEQAMTLYARAVPEQWFVDVIRMSQWSAEGRREAYNIQTSRTWRALRELPEIPLDSPAPADLFAPLAVLNTAEDHEPVELRFLRRVLTVVDVAWRLNDALERLTAGAGRHVRRRLKSDAAIAEQFRRDREVLADCQQLLRRAADRLAAQYAALGGDRASLPALPGSG